MAVFLCLYYSKEGGGLITLSINFLEGFQSDMVILILDGEVIYRNDDVTTMKLTNLADSYQIDGLNTPRDLEIHIPTLDLTESVQIDLTKPFLYVNLTEGGIETELREMPLFLG